jgi:hypothetical protein
MGVEMDFRIPVPWRSFTVDVPLSPDQVEAVVVRALRTEVVRGFVKSADGFRFLQRLGSSLRSGWLLVSCRVQRTAPDSESATTRLRVRMRGPLAGIAMLGAAAILLPADVVATVIARPADVQLGRISLLVLLGPVTWFVFSLEYDRGARALEKRLRGVLQR